jgi:hypothetical protein
MKEIPQKFYVNEIASSKLMFNKKVHINTTAEYIVKDVGTNTEIPLLKAYK